MISEDPRSAHICLLGRMYHVRRRRITTDSIVDSTVVPTYRLSFKRNTSAPILNPPSKGEEIFARSARRCENKKRSAEGKQNRTERRSIKEEDIKERKRGARGGGVKTRREEDGEPRNGGKEWKRDNERAGEEMETKGEREWEGEEERRMAEGRWGGLRANDVDEMLLSGEHVTRPRRIEINAFASWIPAPSPFPLLSSLLFPVMPSHPPPRRIALHSHDGSSFNPFELYLIDEIVGSPRYIRIHRYIHSLSPATSARLRSF